MSEAPARDLRRVLGFWGTVAVVIGTTIGSGVFRKPGTIAALVPDPRLVVALWVFFGLVMLCGALTLAELVALFPRTGGIYVFLRAAYGDAAAFVFGWLYLLVTVPAAMGALALFFGELLGQVIGAPPGAARAVAIASLALLAAINIRGVKQGDAFQKVLTVLKVAALLGIIGAAFFSGRGDARHLTAPGGPTGLLGLALALSSFLWSYSGWQAVSMVAGETEAPPRRVSRAIVVGVLSIVTLYVGANLAYFYILPLDEVAREQVVATRVVRILLGAPGEAVVAACILASVLGALNGQFLAKTRVAYALARDGLSFRILGSCHSRWATPHVSIVVSTAVAAVLILWLKDFDALTAYFASVEWLALLFGVGAVFVLRRRLPEAPRPYRVPGYPWVPLAFLVGGGAALGAVLIGEGLRKNLAPFIGIAISVAGFAVHAVWRRLSLRRARKEAAVKPA